MEKFWCFYKKTVFLLDIFSKLRPNLGRSLTLEQHDGYDRVYFTDIFDISKVIELRTDFSDEEYANYNIEIEKIQELIAKIQGNYAATTQSNNYKM